MPVFSRVKDDVLTLTVDGDYTPNEIRRVAFQAFESAQLAHPMPILLDMSGAAGLGLKSSEDLQATGAIFGAYRDRIRGIGVVVSPDLNGLFTPEAELVREAGVPVRACQSHADARAWLSGGATS